jgi:hypothetical protein
MKRVWLVVVLMMLLSISCGSRKKAAPAAAGQIVYVTKSGKKYHAEGCKSLGRSKIPMKLEDAQKRGLTPCGSCWEGARK